jgi:hypothetical protein
MVLTFASTHRMRSPYQLHCAPGRDALTKLAKLGAGSLGGRNGQVFDDFAGEYLDIWQISGEK